METCYPDFELLRQYVDDRSDEAFRQLMGRHAGLVYGVALRRTRDPGLAEDATQAVFIVLARRSASVREEQSFTGWLRQTARHAAANAMRGEARRRRRERVAGLERREAALPVGMADGVEAMTETVEAELDKLRRRDRETLTTRYLDGLSVDEIAQRFDIAPATAAKRVNRAMERLRRRLRDRGIEVPTNALGPAIVALGAGTPSEGTGAGIVITGNPRAVSIARRIDWSFRMMAFGKIAALVAIAVCMIGGVLAAATMLVEKPVAQGKAAGTSVKAKMANGIELELIGVTALTGDDQRWWAPDGTEIAKPTDRRDAYGAGSLGDGVYGLFLRAKSPGEGPIGRIETESRQISVWGGAGSAGDGPDKGYTFVAHAIPDFSVMDLTLKMAVGEWSPLHVLSQAGSGKWAGEWVSGKTVMWSPLAEIEGVVSVASFDDLNDREVRLVAFDRDGNAHAASASSGKANVGLNSGALRATYGWFKGVTRETLDRVELQSREYSAVTFHDISLKLGARRQATAAEGRLADQPALTRRMYGKHVWNDSLSSTLQFVAFDCKAEIDVRWDELEKLGAKRNSPVNLALHDPTVNEALAAALEAAGARGAKVEWVEDKALNVRKILISGGK